MAVIKRGILGGFQNKIANVVGGSWKGISYMRSLPVSVANPRTTAQVAQRNKFTGVQGFASAILSTVIKPLRDRFAVQMSGYNSFIQKNIALFTNGVLTTPATLSIAEGVLSVVDHGDAVASSGVGTVEFTYTDNTGIGDANADDGLYLVVYNEDKGTFAVVSGVNDRQDTVTSVNIDVDWQIGDTLHIYAAFRSADGYKVSNTTYYTTDIIA